MANIFDMEVNQGATEVLMFTWLDSSTNLPVDLTDCDAQMQIRERHGEQNRVLELNTSDGTVVLGDTDGTITLIFANDILLDLKDFYYVYDLIITKADTSTERLLEGQLTVSLGITNG